MLYFILTILTLIYLLSIPAIRKRKFGIGAILTLRIIILIATPILLAILIAETYNIYPRQYWVTKGLFWIVFFSCMTAFGLCRTEFLKPVEKGIYKIIFFLPLLFLLFLFIPVAGAAYGLIFYVKFIGDKNFILYNDNNIRIEQPYIRFLGPNPRPIVFVKNELTSYKDTTLPFRYDDSEDNVEVSKNGDTTYTITLKSPNNWQVPTGTKSFVYYLKNKQR
jgi:hypothetical protein